ncbi:MAG: hypothetical protein CM15mV116_070 [uncultured marine virus]|nr:MAG: hypothetical protein CM15mV116_070 [uncultured marine virus]
MPNNGHHPIIKEIKDGKSTFISRQDLVTFTTANGNLDPDKFLPIFV